MFWMRNKENYFPVRILIWRPGQSSIKFKDKFILFKALLNYNTYTQDVAYVTFRALLPIFVTSFFTHMTIIFIFTNPFRYPLVMLGPFPAIDTLPHYDKKKILISKQIKTHFLYHADILFPVNGINLST